jgi:hypothetical protein
MCKVGNNKHCRRAVGHYALHPVGPGFLTVTGWFSDTFLVITSKERLEGYIKTLLDLFLPRHY